MKNCKWCVLERLILDPQLKMMLFWNLLKKLLNNQKKKKKKKWKHSFSLLLFLLSFFSFLILRKTIANQSKVAEGSDLSWDNILGCCHFCDHLKSKQLTPTPHYSQSVYIKMLNAFPNLLYSISQFSYNKNHHIVRIMGVSPDWDDFISLSLSLSHTHTHTHNSFRSLWYFVIFGYGFWCRFTFCLFSKKIKGKEKNVEFWFF